MQGKVRMANSLDISTSASHSVKDKRKPIDEHLNDTGVFGFLQIMVHLSVYYIAFTNGGYITISFFTGYNPPWKCTSNNSSAFCAQHFNRTITPGSGMFSQRCKLNRSEWAYTTDKASSYVTEFDLICDKNTVAALTAALFHIGCFIGDIFSGVLSDAYGRRIVIIVSSLILPFPTIASGYITAIWQLHVLNVVRGIASAATYYTAYVYLSEFTPPKYRSFSCNIFFFFPSFSFLMSDLFSYVSSGWRMSMVYMGLLVFPVWGFFFIIPESPRWLLSKGRTEEAEEIIAKKMAYKNPVPISITVAPKQADNSKLYSYLDLVRDCSVFKLTLCLLAMWFAIPIVSYTIGQESMDYGGSIYTNFALVTAADFPAAFGATILTECIGRKIVNVGGLISASVLFGCIPLVPASFAHEHTIKMALTILARLTSTIMFNVIFLWSSELYPTVVRSQGFSVCTIGLKLGMICVPLITTLLQEVSYDLPFIVVGVGGVLAGLAGLLLPETKSQPTREHYEDFHTKGNVNESYENVEVE